MQTYTLTLAGQPGWRGIINSIRLAMSGSPNTEVAIQSIEFIPSATTVSIATSKSQLQFTSAVGTTPSPQVISLASATGSSLSWTATATAPWLLLSAANGRASANITASVNPAGLAVGVYSTTITIGANGAGNSPLTLAVTLWILPAAMPGSCVYSLSNGGQGFPSQGGSGTITITTAAGCPWTVSNLPAWVTLTSAASGVGSGTVTFAILPNSGGDQSGSFTIQEQTFTVLQEASAVPGLVSAGSLAQVASEGNWDFTLDAINLGSSPAEARFNFSDNNGNPLLLPLTFPQQGSSSGPLLASTLDETLNPNAQVILDSTGPATSTALVGWGQLLTNGGISGFGTFSNLTYGWNAVVPLETRNASSYILAFDNTGSLATGVAIANVATQSASIPLIIRDDTGAQIGTASLSLAAQGHTSFTLNQQIPGDGWQARHRGVRHTAGRADQCAGFACERSGFDDTPCAGERRHGWGVAGPRHLQWRVHQHVLSGEHRHSSGAVHVELFR